MREDVSAKILLVSFRYFAKFRSSKGNVSRARRIGNRKLVKRLFMTFDRKDK